MRISMLFVCLSILLQPLVADDTPNYQPTPSEVHKDAVPSLVNLTSLPSAFVNGCVNVITGDLVELSQDDIVSGPDAYELGHNYCSSSLEEGNLGDGWNFLHHHFLEVYQPDRIKYVKKDFGDDTPFLYPIEMTDYYRVMIEGLPPLGGEQFDHDISSSEPSQNPDDSDSLSHPTQDFSSLANGRNQKPFFSHPLDFLHGLFTSKNYYKSNTTMSDPIFISLFEPSGGRLLFKTDYDEDRKDRSMRHFDLVTKNSGFTNLSHGLMSGQTNIKNTSLSWDKKSDQFTVRLGDGTQRIYERQWKRKDIKHKRSHHCAYYRDYQLHKEIKPNGNYTTYQYNRKYEITQVTTYNKNNQQLNWIQFEQKSTGDFAKHPTLCVKTSDEKTHVYHFKKLRGSHMHGTYSVSKIERQGHPDLHFTYSNKDDHKKRRVIQKSCDDGSYIKTKYYTGKSKDLSIAKSRSKKDHKFLKNRVGKQLSPVGPNGSEVATHRYFYYKDDKQAKAGHCTVRDAYNNISRYYWNKDKRLIKVAKFDNKKNALICEEFIWGKKRTYNEGRLRAHIVKDEHGKIRLARKYNYDGRGNVLEDILLARVTKNAGKIWFKNDLTHSETCDKIVTSYTYSNDGFNLKESQCDPLGNYTYYEYYPATNLLKATFTCVQKNITKRDFFAYDESAILVEHIVDDGNSRDKENFDGVTERHMTWITPRKEAPHYGEPEQVLEFYIDLETKERVWLTTTINHYNSKGLVEKRELIDQAGNRRWYEFAHDDIGRLTYSKDPLGNAQYIEYDKTGRITKKRGPRDDVCWQYTYDKAGRLTSENEVHTDGLVLSTHYTYDLLSRKTAVKDPLGNTTRYEYDALNRVTKITYPDIHDHNGKKITPEKTYTYNTLGSVVTETNELGLKTTTTCNALGKITDQEFADGTAKHYFYDVKGNLIKEVSQNELSTHMRYDGLNRLIESNVMSHEQLLAQTTFEHNAFHPIKQTGPTGETVEYGYDLAGRKVAQREQARTTTFSYDTCGRLEQERSHLDSGFIAKSYSYDALDRRSHETLFDHKDTERTYTKYGYDAEGNQSSLVQTIDGQIAESRKVYRPHGLVQEHTDADGNTTHHKVHHNHINDYGQTVVRKEIINAQNVRQEEIFDARGNLVQVMVYDPSNIVIAKKELFYDAAGNCVRVHEKAISPSSVKTITTLFEYTNGHLTRLTEAYGTPEEKTTQYIYNNHAQLQTIIHADGVVLNHGYDAKGRLSHFYTVDYTIDYSYTYDASDRILEVLNNATGKKTTRSYNAFGELASETLETGLTLTYAYDNAGRVSELTLPDGSKVAYSHSAYLDTIQRLDANDEELYCHNILSRDLSGFIKTAALPENGGTLTFCRDKLGRTTKITHDNFEQEVPQNGFDCVGNLLTLQTHDYLGSSTRSFSYDYLSQLTQENGPTTHSYTYDSLYNRLEQDSSPYKVNSLHSVVSDSIRTFSYDSKGNRIKLKTPSDTTHYTYDALDRLVEVATQNMRYSYSYDAFNRRLTKETTSIAGAYWWKNEQSKKEHYLYALDNEIGSVDETLAITELRILGEGLGAEIGAAIALELNGTTYIPIHDRQGNVALLLDLQGNPIESYSYDAFGNETIYSKNATNNPWRFSSKRTDPETNFVYFGRRYYDPSLGKWLTQDPLGLKEGPNLYAYVQNGPMTRFDLYGLRAETEHVERVYTKNGNHVVGNSNVEFGVERDSCTYEDKSIHSHVTKSFPFSIGYIPLSNGGFCFTNGICNTSLDAEKAGMQLSQIGAGIKIDVIYNKTHSLPIDVLECVVCHLGVISTPAKIFVKQIKEWEKTSTENAKFLVCCHSGGADQVKNGLKTLDVKTQQKIIVLAIAPSVIIPRELCFDSFNYISKRDFVTHLDVCGKIKYGKELTILKPHPDAPLWDHDFMSPTFDEVKRQHINEYLELLGGN